MGYCALEPDRDEADCCEWQMKRQCTSYWKVRPLRRYIRDLLRTPRPAPGAVECWMGITVDEFHRMRTSDVQYITNVYPLVGPKFSETQITIELAMYLADNGAKYIPNRALGPMRGLLRGAERRRCVDHDRHF